MTEPRQFNVLRSVRDISLVAFSRPISAVLSLVFRPFGACLAQVPAPLVPNEVRSP
jgi:hypothetical protein